METNTGSATTMVPDCGMTVTTCGDIALDNPDARNVSRQRATLKQPRHTKETENHGAWRLQVTLLSSVKHSSCTRESAAVCVRAVTQLNPSRSANRTAQLANTHTISGRTHLWTNGHKAPHAKLRAVVHGEHVRRLC